MKKKKKKKEGKQKVRCHLLHQSRVGASSYRQGMTGWPVSTKMVYREGKHRPMITVTLHDRATKAS
jgi:membrane-bound lytic murein transglycosylase MltF